MNNLAELCYATVVVKSPLVEQNESRTFQAFVDVVPKIQAKKSFCFCYMLVPSILKIEIVTILYNRWPTSR